MRNFTPQQKNKLVSIYPELQGYFTESEKGNPLADSIISALLSKMKELKGEQGEPGRTPIKGQDYFTEFEVSQIIRRATTGATPKKGVDYFTNSEIDKLISLATPRKGVHYFDGEKGDKGDQGIQGKDGSADSPVEIASKLNTLKGVLDATVIKGAVSKDEFEAKSKVIDAGMARVDGRLKAFDQRWHGGGLSRVSHDSSLSGDGTASSPLSVVGGVSSGYQVPLTGALNQGTFTWTIAPRVIVVDGVPRQKTSTDAGVNWTGTTTTVLTVWPTSDIFAIA